MGRYSKSVLFISMLLMFLGIPSLQAYWMGNGVAICTAMGHQIYVHITDDNAGGAIIAWDDFRNEVPDIYAQRIDSDGNVLWTMDGVAICTAADGKFESYLVSDGTSGAIIAWSDFRNGEYSDIYAQKINSAGIVQWTANGVAVCQASLPQHSSCVINDGAGGAIITWADARSGTGDGIYAQRIDADGNVLWTTDGVAICTTTVGIYCPPHIISDDAEGAIITWGDNRAYRRDIYVQKIDSVGSVQWTPDGLIVCAASGAHEFPRLATDGAGGAIITWLDDRDVSRDIYAQKIDADGNLVWPVPPGSEPDGVIVCYESEEAENLCITSDGAGGAIIAWDDFRNGNRDIYAQRIDEYGWGWWTWYGLMDGLAICTASGDQVYPDLAFNGAEGAIITWNDNRNGDWDIYAQKLRADTLGTILWTADGEAVCTATGNQFEASLISDSSEGAIITWCDQRGDDSDIYAIRVDQDGVTSGVSDIPITSSLSQNFPNPFNPTTSIRFDLPKAAHVKLSVYNVKGELVSIIVDQHITEGRKEVSWTATNDRSRSVASGIYFYRLVAGDFVQTRKMVLLR